MVTESFRNVVQTWSDRIRAVAERSDDLRMKRWRGDPCPIKGHCYVASEALWWAIGNERDSFTPMTVRHEKSVHWWLSHRPRPGSAWHVDPTADQFKTPVPYERGRGRGFLTLSASKRANAMMTRAFCAAVRSEIETLRTLSASPVTVGVSGGFLGVRATDVRPPGRYLILHVMAGHYSISMVTQMGMEDLVGWLSRHVSRVSMDLQEEVLTA